MDIATEVRRNCIDDSGRGVGDAGLIGIRSKYWRSLCWTDAAPEVRRNAATGFGDFEGILARPFDGDHPTRNEYEGVGS